MSPRRRPALAVIVATLAAFLAGVVSPRPGFVVHSHSGGDHAHVHLVQVESEVAHRHHDDAGDHHTITSHHHHASDDDHHHAVADHDHGEHGHSHHHDGVAEHDGHDHAQRVATGTAHGKPILVDAVVQRSGSHWHTQHPYLRFLPSSITQHAMLVALGQYEPLHPAARLGGVLSFPFARGPPC